MLTIEHLRVQRGRQEVLHDLSLRVESGEILAILGRSGCGKSTLLHAVAGILKPSDGRIFLDGADITTTPVECREVGVVFQGYALFPHLSVRQNISFAFRTSRHRRSRNEMDARVGEILKLVGLSELSERPITNISGGEKQRVALARALVFRPKLLLLDEPLSALDNSLRIRFQEEIRQVQQHYSTTTLYVTHNRSEAFAVADRICLIDDRRILQVGTPNHVYCNPINQQVARFLGGANFISGTTTDDGGLVVGKFGRVKLPRTLNPNSSCTIMVRPENLSFNQQNCDDCRVSGVISNYTYHGDGESVFVRLNCGSLWELQVPNGTRMIHPVGATADLSWMADVSCVLNS